MNGVLAGVVAPHPPLLVPAVGGADVARVQATADALADASRVIETLAPDNLVFISPHSPIVGGEFAVRGGQVLNGSFAQFGHGEAAAEIENDLEMADAIIAEAADMGIETVVLPDYTAQTELDWGVLVPYYYVGNGLPIVSLSISVLGYGRHFELGRAVAAAAERLGRRTVFVASGDLSHRLSAESPYGYSPAGPEFDQRVTEIFSDGKLTELADIDPRVVAEAGECGLRSFIALSGALSGRPVESRLLSYEGPFGVGYSVAIFLTVGALGAQGGEDIV